MEEKREDYNLTSVTVGDLRVQLLSDTLVRIEEKNYEGKFEDRESYLVPNRSDWFKVAYTKTSENGDTKIATKNYDVIISGKGVSITDARVCDKSGEIIWRYSGLTTSNVFLPSPSDELNCWYFSDNPRIIPSETGYSPVENGPDLQGWDFNSVAPDFFIFVPGGSYKTFCRDYIRLTGETEMVPLQALGYWDSRYYTYSADTAIDQILEYRENGYSIDVLVVDTDWRVSSSGTGYEINANLFPDVEKFLEECHELGVSVTFNDHPTPYPGTSNALDKEEVKYRSDNLTLILSMGLDFWWYDRNWSWSLNSCAPEISLYAFGMYAYNWVTEEYFDSITDINEYAKRSLILGNVDGVMHGKWVYASDVSAHRYPIQWTGDIETESADLKQELYTAVFGGSEVGLPYISSDLGGHEGVCSADMYARWIQYGALSSVCRVHCNGKAYNYGRMPWLFGDEAEEITHTYVDMRYRLLPLFYALARENYDTGLPVMRRLDIEYPQYVEASRNDEYLLGENILVAPMTEGQIPGSNGVTERTVFIPDGTWRDVWTGEIFKGPLEITVEHGLHTSPIFVRDGGVVALAQRVENTRQTDWSKMALDVYPGEISASTMLYEDDFVSLGYQDGQYRKTYITQDYVSGKYTVKIGAAQYGDGKFEACAEREWHVRIHGRESWGELYEVKVNGKTVRFNKVAQDLSGAPFGFNAVSPDGDIYTFSFTGSVNGGSVIEYVFDRSYSGGEYEPYEDASLDFKLSSNYLKAGAKLNLTEAGTVDWAYFGENGQNRPVRKKYSGNYIGDAFSYDKNWVINSNPVEVSWTDGDSVAAGNAVNNAWASQKDFSLTFDTVGRKAYYVVYLSGANCTAKATVRDRAGNVKTISFGNMDGKFSRRVVIECNDDSYSQLYLNYHIVSGLHDGYGGERWGVSPSNLYLSAVYISETLPELENADEVEVTARQIACEQPPESVNLSDGSNIDWATFSGNGDAVGMQGGNYIRNAEILNGGEFSDYQSSISWTDGENGNTNEGTTSGTWTREVVTLTINVNENVKSLKLYFGAWYATATVTVYDNSGNLIMKGSVVTATSNESGKAVNRIMEIELDAAGQTTITVTITPSNTKGVGNISIAAIAVEGKTPKNKQTA